ncbi:hypothetical protein ACWEFL_31570 [Streptomyces sp. NPDC004838]
MYVDAFAPLTGESAFDLLPWLRDAFLPGQGKPEWQVAPMSYGALGVNDPADVAWADGKTTPIARRTHEEKLEPGSEQALANLEVTYIHCSGQPFFGDTARRCAERGFRVLDWPECGHAPLLTHPKKLAAELLSIAASRPRPVGGSADPVEMP